METSGSHMPAAEVPFTLRVRFYDLQRSLGVKLETADKWSRALVDRYTEQQRYYHTVSHVDAMLDCLDAHRTGIKDRLAVELAVYFHDWIYKPQSKTNEADSVVAFMTFARELALEKEMVEKVVRMIEATVSHQISGAISPTERNDVELFLDFDLEVLGRKWEEYIAYAGQIRREYACFGERDYKIGRAKVLRSFLDRERIYFSESFFGEKEKSARRNIKREIDELVKLEDE
jgi:predicted metal-dependent HD superfamily phosphohydrolase